MGLPLEEYPPGEYELVLTVRDEVSGRRSRSSSPDMSISSRPVR
jgi:hypothetical protein